MEELEVEELAARGSCEAAAVVVEQQLREALVARADRLGLDPASIETPTPGAIIARGVGGELLRLDYRTYRGAELAR